MVKLIKKIDIFKIQFGYGSSKDSEFVYLFAKNSAFINIKVLFKNYKMYVRRNKDQSKGGIDIFEDDKNIDTKKNNKTIINFNYDSNNI